MEALSSGKMGSVDSLSQVVASPDQQTRRLRRRFGHWRVTERRVISLLESELNDSSETNAKEAATALGESLGGRRCLRLVPGTSGVELRRPLHAGEAIEALKNIGPEGLPAIENALGDGDARVRDYAIALLGSYGRAGVLALASFLGPTLDSQYHQGSGHPRGLGPRSLAGADALERTAVSSPDQTTRRLAIGALAKIGPPAYALWSGWRTWNDPDPQTSAEAQSCLKGMRIK